MSRSDRETLTYFSHGQLCSFIFWEVVDEFGGMAQ